MMSLLRTLVPKVLIAFLTIGIFYQLLWHSPYSTEDGIQGATWFQDAVKVNSWLEQDSISTALPQLNYNNMHISYGPTQCMPTFNDNLKQQAIARNESCTAHAPFAPQDTRLVAFASINTGKPEESYQRAILSQMFHTAVHGTSMHILCSQLASGAWNKIAFLLHLLMAEMLKPEHSRLEWIMWIDRDAIILDACRPLSSYLPPATPDYEHVNLITNHDALGLNAGVFMFRVNDWSVELFNAILAFRYYRPDTKLALDEQTAMDIIIQEERWKHGTVTVPWYWFNAYPDEGNSAEKYESGETKDVEWFRARKGDFAVHFAGDGGRAARMLEWHDMLGRVGDVWEKGDALRDVTSEIQDYWESYRSGGLTDAQKSGEPQKQGGWKTRRTGELGWAVDERGC